MNILNSHFFLFCIFKKEGVFWQTLVISNFACTIFGKIECTEIGNMQCT